MKRKATDAEIKRISQFVHWLDQQGLENEFYESWLKSRKVKA
jgi:hypothetical protein